MTRKADAAEIEAWIDGLPSEYHLDAQRSWWPKYVFRYDDVNSVASILSCGELYSRQQCGVRGIEHRDAANQAIIAATPYAHGFVRLYFRPLTPTQYQMEGIKAPQQMTPTGEHCPVPVFLLFDSKALLSRTGVRFTDGSIARAGAYNVGDSAVFLTQLPMDAVYHHGSMPAADKSNIIFRRQAEVLVEGSLDLDDLRWIVCRTGPERDTLIHLLGGGADAWRSRIRLAQPGQDVFYRQGMFLKDVRLVGPKLYFEVPSRGYQYETEIRVWDNDSSALVAERSLTRMFPPSFRLDIDDRVERALVDVKFERALAYRGVVSRQTLFTSFI